MTLQVPTCVINHPMGGWLPLGSAWTDQDPIELDTWINEITFACDFNAQAAGSYCQMRIQWAGAGIGPWTYYDELIRDQAVVFADPFAVVRTGIMVLESPHCTAAGMIRFNISCAVPAQPRRMVRLIAREMGTPLTPGDLELVVLGFHR